MSHYFFEGKTFKVTEAEYAGFVAMYPHTNVMSEIECVDDWYSKNDHQEADRFRLIRRWLKKADLEDRHVPELAALKKQKLELEIKKLQDDEKRRGYGTDHW